MSRFDMSKQDLYEGVKTLVESDVKHIHLPQHKLFTLFSIGFQYLLFQSTKEPGAYVIRIEDSKLADKLCRKAKDPSTRKFIQSLMLPRKFKFEKSIFYLDFFNVGSWNLTAEIPANKLKGALIVKNSTSKLMDEKPMEEEEDDQAALLAGLPEDYYLTSLLETAPKTITVALDVEYDGVEQVLFPFIKKEKEKTVDGVTISNNLNWDEIE